MFRESIQKLVNRLDGGVAGVLMGFDGIAIETYVRAGQPGQGPDLNMAAMEFGHVLGQLRPAAGRLDLGNLREVTVRTDKLVVLFTLLSNDYFLACGILPTGNVGKARYLVKMAAPALRAELQ